MRVPRFPKIYNMMHSIICWDSRRPRIVLQAPTHAIAVATQPVGGVNHAHNDTRHGNNYSSMHSYSRPGDFGMPSTSVHPGVMASYPTNPGHGQVYQNAMYQGVSGYPANYSHNNNINNMHM